MVDRELIGNERSPLPTDLLRGLAIEPAFGDHLPVSLTLEHNSAGVGYTSWIGRFASHT